MTTPHRRIILAALPLLFVAGCAPATSGTASQSAQTSDAQPAAIAADSGAHPGTPVAQAPFTPTRIASLDEPWAMAFIPGTDRAIVTLKRGGIRIVGPSGAVVSVTGAPSVAYGGQGGLGDVIVSAPTATGALPIWLSWVEAGPNGTFGAVVGRGMLDLSNAASPAITGLAPIWRQSPKVTGRGHFSHRLALSPDGTMLFVTSGDRQKFDPAQDLSGNLGKVLRLTPDGRPMAGNPLADRGGTSAEIWSWGHRNLLGIAFDADGRLWTHEMGPAHGDEVNRIVPGNNHGWPRASNGDHYDGRNIPDHRPGDGFRAPDLFWNPAISPAGLVAYDGAMFPDWKGSLLIGGLGSESLIRVRVTGTGDDTRAAKAERWEMGMRVREVEQGPDGSVFLLSDGDGGALWRLDPRR